MTTRGLAPVVLLLATACFPAITHGPRVENGFVFGITGASTTGDVHTEGDEGGFHLRSGVIGPYVGQGWASPDRRKPAAYLGLAVPLFFLAAQGELYVQAPPAWTGPLSAGAGVTGSAEGGSWFGELGYQPESGIGWQVMGGYGVRSSSSYLQSSSPAWIGSVGLSYATGRLRGLLFVQGANGRAPGSCIENSADHSKQCETGPRARAVSFGVSLGRHQRSVGPAR